MTDAPIRGVQRNVRALLVCLTVAVVAALATDVDRARACSCALPDARAALAQGDGAFVGTLESRRASGRQHLLVFRVEKVLKGAIGGFATVVTASNSAACGIELAEGTRVGLVLERVGGAWHGSLCSQFEPRELLAAAAPLPPPTGRGPVALVVGGEFGRVRMIALDRRGRTLAYGRGGGRGLFVSFCPGRQRLVEVASTPAGSELVVRRVATLDVVRRQALRLPGERFPVRAGCQDARASNVVVFAKWPLSETRKAGLYRLRPGRVDPVWGGAAHDAAIAGTSAFVSAGLGGTTLLRVDLASGRTTRLAALPGPTAALVVDASSRRVAGVAARPGRSADVVRVDLRSARVSSRRLPADEGVAQVFWLAGGHLVFVPTYGGTARVLDGRLRTRSRFVWRAMSATVVDRALFGVDLSLSLFRADLPSGPQRLARRLPGRSSFIASAD